jgi:transcriptional regulator GlxA family with amidase domain
MLRCRATLMADWDPELYNRFRRYRAEPVEHILSRLQLGDAEKANLKISSIARQAGFADMSYFNRSFRNRFGDTPSGYRKRFAVGSAPFRFGAVEQ